MSKTIDTARMTVTIERCRSGHRERLSVPLNRDLSLFVGVWDFPRLVGRVSIDGTVSYDRPEVLQ